MRMRAEQITIRNLILLTCLYRLATPYICAIIKLKHKRLVIIIIGCFNFGLTP